MFKPISLAAGVYALASYTGLVNYARQSNAVSAEAVSATAKAELILKAAATSETLNGQKAWPLASLGTLAQECATDNWDGYGAQAVNLRAIATAEHLIRNLPEGLQVPEVAAEPDGSVSLDWIVSRHRLLSVSVGESNRFAFAWMLGTEREHGVINFDGVHVPGRLIQKILFITDPSDAAVRVA